MVSQLSVGRVLVLVVGDDERMELAALSTEALVGFLKESSTWKNVIGWDGALADVSDYPKIIR